MLNQAAEKRFQRLIPGLRLDLGAKCAEPVEHAEEELFYTRPEGRVFGYDFCRFDGEADRDVLAEGGAVVRLHIRAENERVAAAEQGEQKRGQRERSKQHGDERRTLEARFFPHDDRPLQTVF